MPRVKRTSARFTLVTLAVLIVSCSQPSSDRPATSGTTTATPTPTSVPATTATSAGIPAATTLPAITTAAPSTDVLVFHKTGGFRHPSIDNGIAALSELASAGGFDVVDTADASVFGAEGLEPFAVVVFLSTTREVLDEAQQAAMEEFIRSGKGFVGIHAASDTEYEWAWYGALVGAYFDGHPAVQPAEVTLVDPGSHPVVEGIPPTFERRDEWYNFRAQPGPEVTVLATVDESTYEGGTMGDPHPIVWAQEYDGGRSVYIGFGHAPESFEEPLMRTLLANALQWAAGQDR